MSFVWEGDALAVISPTAGSSSASPVGAGGSRVLSNTHSRLQRQMLRACRVRDGKFTRISPHPCSPHPGGCAFIHPFFLRLASRSIYNPRIDFA